MNRYECACVYKRDCKKKNKASPSVADFDFHYVVDMQWPKLLFLNLLPAAQFLMGWVHAPTSELGQIAQPAGCGAADNSEPEPGAVNELACTE